MNSHSDRFLCMACNEMPAVGDGGLLCVVCRMLADQAAGVTNPAATWIRVFFGQYADMVAAARIMSKLLDNPPALLAVDPELQAKLAPFKKALEELPRFEHGLTP